MAGTGIFHVKMCVKIARPEFRTFFSEKLVEKLERVGSDANQFFFEKPKGVSRQPEKRDIGPRGMRVCIYFPCLTNLVASGPTHTNFCTCFTLKNCARSTSDRAAKSLTSKRVPQMCLACEPRDKCRFHTVRPPFPFSKFAHSTLLPIRIMNYVKPNQLSSVI